MKLSNILGTTRSWCKILDVIASNKHLEAIEKKVQSAICSHPVVSAMVCNYCGKKFTEKEYKKHFNIKEDVVLK